MSDGEWPQPREPEDRQLSPSDTRQTASTPEPDDGDVGDSVEYIAPDFDNNGAANGSDDENGIICKVEMVEGG
ncbi:hypothetical protein MTO96_008259 [Rhipicephalus appendiculatus]